MATSPARRARLKARRDAEHLTRQARLEALRLRGASCATCAECSVAPPGLVGYVCDRGCDFDGYQMTALTDFCADHRPRHAPPADP